MKKTPRKPHHPCFQNVKKQPHHPPIKDLSGAHQWRSVMWRFVAEKRWLRSRRCDGKWRSVAGFNTLTPNTKDQEIFLEDKRFGRSESAHRIRRFYIYTVPMKYVNLCGFLHVEALWGRNWVLRIIVVIQLPKGTPTGRVK